MYAYVHSVHSLVVFVTFVHVNKPKLLAKLPRIILNYESDALFDLICWFDSFIKRDKKVAGLNAT